MLWRGHLAPSLPQTDNPTGDDEASYPVFQQTAAELETRIWFLLAAITNRVNPAPTTPQEEP